MDYLDQVFPRKNVRFISINDEYDSNNHMGKTMDMSITFRQIINAYYSKDLSKKVKSAKRLKASNGAFLSPYPVFGYKKSKENHNVLEVEPSSAEIVRYTFKLANENVKPKDIAKRFNMEQIGTPSFFKNQIGIYHPWPTIGEVPNWTSTSILKILSDERYLGKMIYGKSERKEIGKINTRVVEKNQWIVKENTHEPLVSQEDFDGAQKVIVATHHKQVKIKKTFLFSKKIRCGICHHTMRRNHCSYKCDQVKFDPILQCGQKIIKEIEISTAVLKILQTYLKLYVDRIKNSKQKRTVSFLKSLEKKESLYIVGIEKCRKKKLLLYEEFMESKLELIEFQEKTTSCDNEISSFELKLEKIHQEIVLEKEKTGNQSPLSNVSKLEKYITATELTREMVETFVDCIYVYPDKRIHIDWKIKDININ